MGESVKKASLKNIFNIIVAIQILIGCSSTDKNTKLIEGSWQVASLSETPLTITNYGEGRIDSSSIIKFGNDGLMKILHSDSMNSAEVFRYEVNNDELIIFYSDYGIPFHIESITSDKLEVKASGYGNTSELRSRIRRIELIRDLR